MQTNATRFISAYNKIDKVLRARHNLKSGVSFNEVVRKNAAYSAIVRKYEDELIGYARLRNAIVHSSDDKMIIAEPHTSVVEHIEHIADVLLAPPLAVTHSHGALTLAHGVPLIKAVKTMTDGGYSNVPVIKNGEIAGVTTNKLIVEYVARNLKSGNLDELFHKASVFETLSAKTEHFEIMRADVTVDDVLDAFSKNPKLQIVILTQDGTAKGTIKGVLTTGDIIKLNDLLF